MTNKKQQKVNKSEKDLIKSAQVEVDGDNNIIEENDVKQESEFDQLKRENIELLDKYQRSLAEVENIRKRSVNDLLNNTMFANQKLLLEIIDVIKFFDMAMSYSETQENSAVKNFITGFKMIYDKLNNILKDNKVIEIETKIGQEFDPKKHETFEQIENDQYKPGQIVNIIEKGYMLHDRVIKSAKVNICKSKAENNDKN